MKQKLKLSTSITDFSPLFGMHEQVFKGLQTTGVDGVELVLGLKSRWSVAYYKGLSKKYNLPYRSVHQPIWSGLNFYFDEGFIHTAKALSVSNIVFHPLSRLSLKDRKMQTYFEKLATMQEKYHIHVLLENLPQHYNFSYIDKLFPADKSTSNVMILFEIAEKYNFKLTLDIDHLHITQPHKEPWFAKVLPRIGNIHLSSFSKTGHHLPLYMGDFKAKEFVTHLTRNDYKGLLTFEIYYPSLINAVSYNFEAIKKSVKLLRSI